MTASLNNMLRRPDRRRPVPRLLSPVTLCLAVVVLSGCSSWIPEITPYGAVKGNDSYRSVNGLAVHKKMWESTGAKCLTPQKLSPKLETMDTIVLVGTGYGPPGRAARDWLENWLGNEEGRTLVYFGRDFNANLYYRQKTLDQLDGQDRRRGEQALARAQMPEINGRIRQVPESTFCRWFYLDTTHVRREYSQFKGPWAKDLQGLSGTWPVGIALQPPGRRWRNAQPSWLAKGGTATTLKPASQIDATADQDGVVRRSTWVFDELADKDDWKSEFRDLASSETLLSGEDGQPLVFRLTSKQFQQSQILLVANGAPFLNGSLVEPLHRKVGQKLIKACSPAQRVAILAYNESGLLIMQSPEDDSRGAGLEMLTVWPLSAITMPAALLGIVICAVLFPILGRPQRLVRRNLTDFGLHIEALGQMLHESRDIEFARKSITEYFRKVRGESPPDWLKPTTQPAVPQSQNPSSIPDEAPVEAVIVDPAAPKNQS